MDRKEKAKTLDGLVKEAIIYMAKNDINTLNEILSAANQNPHGHRYSLVDIQQKYESHDVAYQLCCSCGEWKFSSSREFQLMKENGLIAD